MIRHIVMWRMKPGGDGSSKEERAQEMKTRLEALPPQIPVVRRLEVGVNISPSERASDVVLSVEFDSLEELAAYSAHPAHQEVVTFIRGIAGETRVVDYLVSRGSLGRPMSEPA